MEALREMRLPPGFGFHPSDAELISHYLKRKVHGQRIEYDLIPEVDIYKHEPWDLPSKCNLPIEDNKWHFFASRDRKYPTGARSNRATRSGYWKSTGKDRAIKLNNRTLGTKKTLVFHEGRPPSGTRTQWIMHEYYIDENECQTSPDMKDAFVLCRVTRRDDWALENDNGVGNRKPHLLQANDAATSDTSAEKQGDAATSAICAGEPNHVGTEASPELLNDVASKASMEQPTNSDSELQALWEELLADFPSSPAVATGSAGPPVIEQDVESMNLQCPYYVGQKMETDHASPGIDSLDGLTCEDIENILRDVNGDFATEGIDHVVFPNNPEGTQIEELQLHQESCYDNLSNENADNGITVRRRVVTASSANNSSSTRRIRLQVGINKMVTTNSETINQTIRSAGTNGSMRSFKQPEATRPSKNLSNQGNSRAIKGVFRSSAGFNLLFACVCMTGVIAAVLHGYCRSIISF